MLEHFGAIFLFTTFTPHKREGLVRSAAPGFIPAREREDRGKHFTDAQEGSWQYRKSLQGADPSDHPRPAQVVWL